MRYSALHPGIYGETIRTYYRIERKDPVTNHIDTYRFKTYNESIVRRNTESVYPNSHKEGFESGRGREFTGQFVDMKV